MPVTRTLLHNGSKTFLLHAYLESDGATGELDKHVLADATVYDSLFTDYPLRPNMKLTVTQVWYSLSRFDAIISFDNTNPVPCWVLPRDSHNYVDFRHFGGLADRLVEPDTFSSTNRTGKILLSTKDFAPANSVGTMVLEVRKSSN